MASTGSCRHKIAQRFYSVRIFQSGRLIGLSPSRGSLVGALEISRWQQRRRVGWDVTDAGGRSRGDKTGGR